jgi:cytoskeletal protein CcmA (bactofilin family)
LQNQKTSTPVTPELVVGAGVHITGSIKAPAGVQVHGVLEGDLTAGQVLVGETGRVLGSLVADVADIHGEISKDVTVRERVILRRTAVFSGTLKYQAIEVESGARLNGSLSTLEQPAPAAVPAAAAAALAGGASGWTRPQADASGEDLEAP